MTTLFVALVLLLAVNLAGAVVATRIIAGKVAADNPPAGRFIAVGGGRLHLHEVRPLTGNDELPVLLLHGATSNALDLFVPLARAFARRRHLLAPDRPGHGWSDRLDEAQAASPAFQAARLIEMLDVLGTDRVIVVGHSWSGALATCLALNYPGRVAGLVLLAPATHPWPGGINWYYRLAALPLIGRLFTGTLVAPVGAAGFRRSVIDSFAPLPAPGDYVQASAASLVLRPPEFRWNAQDVAGLRQFVTLQAPLYGQIACPVAIIASADDKVVYTNIHARPLAAVLPQARLTILPGGAHQIQYGATDIVVAAIDQVTQDALSVEPEAPGRASSANAVAQGDRSRT